MKTATSSGLARDSGEKIFDFKNDAYTHMPFAAPGAPPDFCPAEFCCIMVNGKWKLHRYLAGAWARIPTGLPEDATECSPCGFCDPANEKWSLSFIAGGSAEQTQFYLYRIADLANPESAAVIAADAGFVWKEKIVYAGRRSCITVAEGTRRTTYTLTDEEYLYRVSPHVERPQELIVSGQKTDGTVFSRLLAPMRKTLRELSVDGEAAYKGIIWNGRCYYARRDGKFEERHIVCSDRYRFRDLPYEENVTEKETAGEPVDGWEFE